MALRAQTNVSPVRPSLASLLRRVGAALALHQQRRSLAVLDDHLLDDIGITREAADAEAALPFWNAPQRWRD
jgi:uncharacterized protein YjiS (DUF1127 family)